METKILKRTLSPNRWIGGVCGGLGKYFGSDPTIWRLIFMLGTIFTIVPFPLMYIIMWIVLPKETL